MSSAAEHARGLIEALHFPPDPELEGTPERLAELWASFVPGPRPPLSWCATVSDDPVVMRGVPFYSLCAHHFLPFFGTAAIAVRPSGRIPGLGGLPRMLDHFARRPQIQERLAGELADAVQHELGARSVVVAIRARHLCVEMRGPRVPAEVAVVAARGDSDPWLLSQVEGP